MRPSNIAWGAFMTFFHISNSSRLKRKDVQRKLHANDWSKHIKTLHTSPTLFRPFRFHCNVFLKCAGMYLSRVLANCSQEVQKAAGFLLGSASWLGSGFATCPSWGGSISITCRLRKCKRIQALQNGCSSWNALYTSPSCSNKRKQKTNQVQIQSVWENVCQWSRILQHGWWKGLKMKRQLNLLSYGLAICSVKLSVFFFGFSCSKHHPVAYPKEPIKAQLANPNSNKPRIEIKWCLSKIL